MVDIPVEEQRTRRGIRRVVVVVPSFFTLANLFFGFWAIVMATIPPLEVA